jgi:pyruvate carboxylase subunit B
MAKRQIKFSLIYRDMWQSSGKYQPRVDQLKKIAPVIVKMGCFSRVETNGGAFEQVNLLYGEDPNNAVREWTKTFNEAGIQTHMLERALNGIRMFPVPADVRQLMYKVKKAQGTDIARSFDGLNDHRNLELSIKYAKEAGMISQAALSITHSKIHTVEYYMDIVDKAVEYGADEICLKDMAGVGRPQTLGRLVKAIKDKHPKIIVQYHGHAGPGFSVASMLEVARAGADYVDVAMEPLSWGMVHPDVITIREMLDDAGFDVPEINMEAYMEARALTQSFIDDFLGYWINPKNRYMSSLMIQSGLPGGMMGSLMADLKGVQQGINLSLKAADKPELSEDELLVKLFDEVAYVWPKLGFPPLVTPFSQYVKNVALMNIVHMARGEARYSSLDENTWNMILGKAGKLPGPLAPEIIKLAKEQKKEFYNGIPQDAYPNVLDKFRKEMEENGWETGQDDEELFEFAMHENQYRDYKTGLAKEMFEKDLAKMKAQQNEPTKSKSIVTEKAKPQRSSYNKNKVEYPIAMIGFLLYTMNNRKIEAPVSSKHDVWSSIGFWRNMMKIDVAFGEEEIPVYINKANNNNYEFEIGEETFEAQLLAIDTGEIDFKIDDDSYLAEVNKGEDNFTKVKVNNEQFQFLRKDLLDTEVASHDDDNTGDDSNRIIAPIPGRVFKIEVKEGSQVKKGDLIMIIEAMKMENNITASKDCKISKLLVTLNEMVEAGHQLAEIE